MRWDMKCPTCGHVIEVHKPPSQIEYTGTWCPECWGDMEWVPTPTAFVVKGYNAKGGYAKKEE